MAPPQFPRSTVDRHLHDSRKRTAGPGFVRQTYCLNRHDAREKAREWFSLYPKAAYWTQVESWRLLDGDVVEFTMRRLPSAD